MQALASFFGLYVSKTYFDNADSLPLCVNVADYIFPVHPYSLQAYKTNAWLKDPSAACVCSFLSI